jgi:small subunit ribosomal protein S17
VKRKLTQSEKRDKAKRKQAKAVQTVVPTPTTKELFLRPPEVDETTPVFPLHPPLPSNENNPPDKTGLFKAIVISTKMQKTAVVAVNRPKKVKRLNIILNSWRKFFAHDEHSICDPGDRVLVKSSRPYSKRKRFEIVRILRKEAGAGFLRAHPEYKDTQTSKIKDVWRDLLSTTRVERPWKTKEDLTTADQGGIQPPQKNQS